MFSYYHSNIKTAATTLPMDFVTKAIDMGSFTPDLQNFDSLATPKIQTSTVPEKVDLVRQVLHWRS